MSVIPCEKSAEELQDYNEKVSKVVDALLVRAHEIVDIGVPEDKFYTEGYFRAAIERLRGQFAADMKTKKELLRTILNELQDRGIVRDWTHAGNRDRHDYTMSVSGITAVVEQKGCMDGNNINISERPPSADEFYIWSICTNRGSDIGHGVSSGIGRIVTDMIVTKKKVDGVIVWDGLCGDGCRGCPKIAANPERVTQLRQFRMPPPCVYVFPSTIGHVRENPKPPPRKASSLKFASELIAAYGGDESDVFEVSYALRNAGAGVQKQIEVSNAGKVVWSSTWADVKRIVV